MNRNLLFGALAVALGAAPLLPHAQEPAADAPAAAASTPAPEIKVRVSVAPGIDGEADKAVPLYVEFLASPRLTGDLRAALAGQGYRLVDSRGDAAVVYELDGAYQALRPATQRTAEVRAGTFAEKPDALETKSGRGPSVVLSLNPVALVLGNVLSNINPAREAMNAGTAGDPDGKCLAKCEGWLYRQRAVINLTRIEGGRSSRASSLASVEAPALGPGELFARSAEELAKATGLPLPAAFVPSH